MIKLENLTKIYNPKKRNNFTALRGISLEISKGGLTAIMGRSGSGKSTLLHIIGLLDDFTEGEYLFNGKPISGLSESAKTKLRAEKFGFVKQDFALIEDYSVLDNVMLPLYPIKAKHKKERALKAIKSMGIEHLADKSVRELSGGEKQRTAIARAIVTEPEILLADEPTGALDTKTSTEIVDALLELNHNGKTVVIVTHDTKVAELCKRVVRIEDGVII